jgi:hypothetical protein
LVTVEPASTPNVDAAPSVTGDWFACSDEETLEDEPVCKLLDELLLLELDEWEELDVCVLLEREEELLLESELACPLFSITA